MRRFILAISVLAPLFCVSSSALAQGLFLPVGRSGFEATGEYWSNEDRSGLSGYVGYSINGVLDLSVGVGRSANDEVSGFSIAYISGAVRWHVLKQTENMRFGLSVSPFFGAGSVSSEELDFLGWDMSSSSFGLSMFVYGVIRKGDDFDLRPGMGVAFTQSTTKLEDSFGDSLEDSDDAVSFSVSMPMAFGSPENTRLKLTPSVEFDEDVTTFAIGAGVLIGL